MELTKKDLVKIRNKIAKQNIVFSDKKYLDSLFLPGKIIGRQNEAENLLRHIESMEQGLVVPLVSVYGRSGSGKSTIVKFVCQNITDIASSAYVNLRKSKTTFGCANLILSELGAKTLKSAEGLNRVVDRISEKIESVLTAENKKLFILVIDEYDVIFSDPRGKPSDFVYKLLTLEESLREKGLLLCIITISNNALIDYNLDDRVKSRMGNSEVFFAPYSKDNVLGILRDRAMKAFSIEIPDNILDYCSELSSNDHGDSRRALDLLRLAGELCDGTKITKSDIEKAQEQLQKDRISTIVLGASYQLRVVIAAICSKSFLGDDSWISTSTIYEKYSTLVKKDIKPLSYRRIIDLLIELENTGLVISRTLSRGRYGYGTEYKLRWSPEMIGPSIGKEWWKGLLDSKRRKDSINETLNQMSPRMRRRYSSYRNLFS